MLHSSIYKRTIMRICSKQRIGVISAAAVFFVAVVLLITFYNRPYIKTGFQHQQRDSSIILVKYQTQSVPHRKLIGRSKVSRTKVEPNRIWGDKCSKSDIIVNQGPTAPLPNGIPTYTVEIMNVCSSGCDISNIHLTCGWFSSARLINPKVFKRLRYDDCIVNDGNALANGGTLSFQYANTFRYPLSVSSVDC